MKNTFGHGRPFFLLDRPDRTIGWQLDADMAAAPEGARMLAHHFMEGAREGGIRVVADMAGGARRSALSAGKGAE